MLPSPRSVAVGVDLGSATTTVSTRREGEPPQTRDVRQSATPVAGESETTRTAAPEDADESVVVGLAVPATWNPTRRRAHAEAAANAGFDAAFVVPEPEAAARQFAEAEGRPLAPGASLVVCNVGAASCHVAVVRRDGDRYEVEAAKSTDDIGGRAFDQLLLDHLAGRPHPADDEYWARLRNPGETALRTGALEEVRRAREHLSEHPSATVVPPGLDRELRLTREDAERCLTPAVLMAVSLIEDVMREAEVEVDRIAALLLVGGASRTPLVASVLGHHLGVEPVRPELPDLVIAEGTALAGLARLRGAPAAAPAAAPRFTRLRTSPDVLVTMTAVIVMVLAFAGVGLVNRDDSDVQGLDADSMAPSAPGTAGGAASDEAASEGAEEESTEEAASSETPGGEEEAGGQSPSADSATTVSATGPASASPVAEVEGTVPDVVGESVADAERLLADAGFTNVVPEGEYRSNDGPKYRNCEVTAQSPGGGEQYAHDDPVTVGYVYRGNDSC
ncbi:Hsp70 family protein [Glycomyces sp. A-F 0318]|uniref:Hsp70 family protein n=1 Tax=Glycomyces amatae TaxID=2881355 RepID=UPI001E555B9C|nr:Hsp70 family protein [Glycomyces amatae]MCD0443215.1 Hsp70 family protein [Glycomyces amatae]